MPDEQDPQEGAQLFPLERMSAEVEYVYVSAVQAYSNNWDVRMFFADRQPDNSLVPKLGIVMSHQHAKAFSLLLQKQIKGLEDTFGPIELRGTSVLGEVEHKEQPASNEG